MNYLDILNTLLAGDKNTIYQLGGNDLRSVSNCGVLATNFRVAEASQCDLESTFSNISDWLRLVSATDSGDYVFLDTTTLCTVKQLIEDIGDGHGPVTAEMLFDLSTFVNAVILYDGCVHLQNTSIETEQFNDQLGNEPIFIGMPVTLDRFGVMSDSDRLLQQVWDESCNKAFDIMKANRYNHEFEELDNLRKAWSLFLNRRIDYKDLFRKNELHNWSSSGPQLLNELVSQMNQYPFGYSLNMDAALISECNYRAFFNNRVAQLLKLPYLPNVARYPARASQYRIAKATREVFAEWDHSLLQEIDSRYKNVSQNSAIAGSENLVLPFFLSVVLSGVDSAESFWQHLAEVRKQAKPLRQRRAELSRALWDGDQRAIRAINAALIQETNAISRNFQWIAASCAVIFAILPNISTTKEGCLLMLAALKAGNELPEFEVELLCQRIFHPDLWVLSKMADSANNISKGLRRVQTIWKLKENEVQRCAERLNILQSLKYG